MKTLEGKVALVMGASQGIGAQTARALAVEGAHVVCASRRRGAVEQVAEAIRADGGEAAGMACDVRQFDQVEECVAATLRRYGRLDHLVNNAALIQPLAPLAEADMSDWANAVEVGLVGTFNGCRAALPVFHGQGSGVIVNLSSGAAHRPIEGWSAYNAGKAGCLALLGVLAVELAPFSPALRVYGFQPGAVDTPLLDSVRSSGMGYVASMPREDLLPADIPAKMIAWLMSDDAADLSGQELDIRDAGLRARAGLPERDYL